MTKCRNCGEEIRRIEPGEGYDLREYQWTHAAGGLLCDVGPPYAEPASGDVTPGSGCGGGGSAGIITISGGDGSASAYLGGGGSGGHVGQSI